MTYLVARVRDLRQKRSVQPRRQSPVTQIVLVPWFSNVTSVVVNRHESQRCKFCFFIVDLEISSLATASSHE
jgi:hypothetical protein